MRFLTDKTLLLIRALRIYQWSKNLLVLAALVFARQVLIPEQLAKSLLAFVAFSFAASATYLFNDILDIEKDRAHPKKRKRPIASGELNIPLAIGLSALLFLAALAIACSIRPQFLLALLFYITLTTSYSLILKHLIIIDVLSIALGFVARAMAGAIALEVVFSNWLVVCTLFLALFLGLSKRRQEILLMDDGAHEHRRVLYHYSVHYLDQLILIVAGGALPDLHHLHLLAGGGRKLRYGQALSHHPLCRLRPLPLSLPDSSPHWGRRSQQHPHQRLAAWPHRAPVGLNLRHHYLRARIPFLTATKREPTEGSAA